MQKNQCLSSFLHTTETTAKARRTDHHITELDAAPSLISSFFDLQSSLPKAKLLSLKELDRDNMSPDIAIELQN
jgi:hypothetical protein